MVASIEELKGKKQLGKNKLVYSIDSSRIL